ncbi:MAG: methyltransferase domain-containing protein [Blastocatellia bacterium]|nr:methyltransferase domain-containing protein [Blastocatellia bacterium]
MMRDAFARRSEESELIDGGEYGADEYIDTLADLRRVNRYLGGSRALTRHLFPMIEAEATDRRRIRLLDVGTGSGDIPSRIVLWARAHDIEIECVVIDLNELAAAEAAARTRDYPEIRVVRADAMQLPFADDSFDFVIASMFLHHFETPQAASLLRRFARVARVAFIINDLRRHPIAYYTIKLLTRIFTRNRLVRNDAALSVLRGFADPDLAEIAGLTGASLRIFRHFPYRYILIGPL